jgi:hypothetical protein
MRIVLSKGALSSISAMVAASGKNFLDRDSTIGRARI